MRLPDVDPEQLDEDQQRLYAALSSRPEVQAMGLVGPFGVWMHAPAMGDAMARLGRNDRKMGPVQSIAGHFASGHRERRIC